MIGNIHFPSSMEFQKQWFSNLQKDSLNQRFAIEAPEVGLIGLSSIINIDWRNNHAWHGIVLGDVDVRGKGFGIDAVMATMRYAFDEMHLERLEGSIIEYNKPSYSFYCEKLGWVEEGKRRNYYYRKGKYWDQLVVGITRGDYQELLKRTKYWDK
jgi:RimJ/RimL family protein N-acetyltransferase